ncbi:hypothetical protein AAIR98_000498 [Elusimicrobium simillimum]|uniref:hypothetical protein n=1 Tax=Elusimicrobium simillimum TaxID=3143438 RepID=UPI003C6FD79F
MKKSIILFSFALLAFACTKAEQQETKPLQSNTYPCGMSFSHFAPLEPQKHGNTGDFIVHFANEKDYTMIYMCNKEISPLIQSQMQDSKNAQYKKNIKGRNCFKTDWEHSEGKNNFYTNRVLCDNNGVQESLKIEIPLWKDNVKETKKLSETILSTISFQ